MLQIDQSLIVVGVCTMSFDFIYQNTFHSSILLSLIIKYQTNEKEILRLVYANI